MKQYLTILIFFIFCISFPSCEAVQFNHSQQANDFIKTLNSKDFKKIETFVVNHFSIETLAQWNGAGKDRYVGYSINSALFHGKLLIVSSELETINDRVRYVGNVHSINTDMQYELIINFNNEKSKAITGWYLREAPKALEAASISESQMVNQLTEYINQLANKGIFSGALLLAKEDDILMSAAHGFASRRYDVLNNINTKFQIGSMNKMFTSVAVLQLVDDGKVALNDPLTKYIKKEQLGQGNFEQVQIQHLLSHTSGLSGLSGFEERQSKIRSLQDIQDLYHSIETTFTPGSQWRYSNTGMLLLGQVIESVTGDNYFEYINKHIYQKANMVHSGSFDLDVPVKNTARNYWFSVETGQITENLMFQSVKGLPAGGGYSTVGDLHKFAIAMQSNTLVSYELAQEAIRAKPKLNALNWGYGFSVRDSKIGVIVGHNGAHLGMTARLNMYQDKGYILVVLGNYLSSAWPIVAKAEQLLKALK